MLETVLSAASSVFGRPVLPTDDFFALGGDSVCAVEIALVVEERTGHPVDPVDLLDATDFTDFAGRLSKAAGE